MSVQSHLLTVCKAAIKAGEDILEVYEQDFEVETKSDESPLTMADKKAHLRIVDMLAATNLPILSEEGRDIAYEERNNWPQFWMVDPLDGTKEFVKRNGEFTVNIALIEDGKSILGVIYVPVKKQLFFGGREIGAVKIDNIAFADVESITDSASLFEKGLKLPNKQRLEKYVVVGSRSHMSKETEDYVEEMKKEHGEVEITSMGSSLKLCLIAEGAANVYPRFAPTMEWDTAAGQAIIEATNKNVLAHSTMEPMLYNKENLLNDWFIAK